MKVTSLETIRTDEFPNILWVQVATDEGLTGLGETFYGPAAAECDRVTIGRLLARKLIGAVR